MEITERIEQETTIATLSGKMDAESTALFNQWFSDRRTAGQSRFILDFGGVSYLSSAGLRAVLSAYKSLENQQGQFAVCGLYGIARQVFQVTGLLGVMPVFPDVTESLSGLQKAQA